LPSWFEGRGRLRDTRSHEVTANGAGLTAIPVTGYGAEASEPLRNPVKSQ